jgi:RNA polymerase sigma-70 factor (ECF subfamily)
MDVSNVIAGSTDRALLAAVAGGDQAALGVLYDRHAELALGLACRIVEDRAVGEEIVQEAFVALWRRAGGYRPERGEPRSWLLSIVRQQAIERLRGAAEQRVDLDASAPASEAGEGDGWAAAGRIEGAQIAAALAELPAEQREPIELAFFGGLTSLEIAASTRQPVGTVRGRVRQGLLRLGRELRGLSGSPARARLRPSPLLAASPPAR